MQNSLQNHPGYRDIPTSSFRIIRDAKRNKQKIMSPWRRLAHWVSIYFVIISCSLFFLVLREISNSDIGQVLDKLLIFSPWLLPIIIYGVLLFKLHRQPQFEQKLYYKISGTKPLTLEQREALRLDVMTAYQVKGWSETLALLPMKELVSHKAYDYYFLEFMTNEIAQRVLHNDFEVRNREDYLKVMNNAWSGRSSIIFGIYMFNHIDDIHNDEYMNEAIKIVDTTLPKVLQYYDSNSTKPSLFLWGYELSQTLILSRLAYCVGFISEREAWEYLSITSNYVYALFDNYDDYYQNLLFGCAFLGIDSDNINSKKQDYDSFQRECRWPIKDLPWRKRDPKMLPEHIKNMKEVIVQMMNESNNEQLSTIEAEEMSPTIH